MGFLADGRLKELVDIVWQTGFEGHRYLGHGHAENVYENCLRNRFRKKDLKVEQQVPLNDFDEDGSLLEEFFADLVIEGKLIVELKAVTGLADAHFAQVLGYLRASRLRLALWLNFGATRFKVCKLAM